MKTKFTWCKDGEFHIGYLDEYPGYQTQGESLEDLKAHLLDLHARIYPPMPFQV